MSFYKFGPLEAEVTRGSVSDGIREFLIVVRAPGVKAFKFHTFKRSDMDSREAARLLMVALGQAWMDPADYISHEANRTRRMLEDEHLPPEEIERETEKAKTAAQDLARYASIVARYMNDVADALWKMARVPKWGDPWQRGPREWFPGRKGLSK